MSWLSKLFPSRTAAAELASANAELRREIESRKLAEASLRKSEQLFQGLFENSPEAKILIDSRGQILRANTQSRSLFALSNEEMASRTLESLLPERFHPELATHFSTPRPAAAIELVARRADGTEFPIELTLSSLNIDESPHVLAIVRDITARRRAREALAASEARYHNIFDSLPVGLFEVDFTEVLRLVHRVRPEANGNFRSWLETHPEFVNRALRAAHILDANPMAVRMLGATSTEHILASLPRLFSAPDMLRDFAENLLALERGDLFSAHETLGRKIDGTPIFVLQTVSFPRPETRGRALFSVIDITERKLAERERDQFFELSHDLFGIADFDGYFKRLNPAWEHTLGYPVAELIGTHLSALIDPNDLPATMVRHEQLQSSPGEHSFEVRYRAKDGNYRWMSGNAVSDPQHRLIYFTLRDIAERRRSEDEIRRQNVQLEIINRELEAFSYSISHDLRAPLRHIDGFANLLTKHASATLDEKGQRYLATISKSALKLGQLVDDLLDFSRIGRATLRLETVDNDALVSDVIREGAYNENGNITWQIDPLPAVVASNATIRQVWTNLIDNAVKYSRSSSSPSIAIRGESTTSTGEHHFWVHDNGVGFDMAYSNKLFGVFSRLHGPAEFEGTGIGLANVRRIILRHGGRVWAEGRVGEGATFHFTLPIVPPLQGSIPPFTRA